MGPGARIFSLGLLTDAGRGLRLIIFIRKIYTGCTKENSEKGLRQEAQKFTKSYQKISKDIYPEKFVKKLSTV